MLDYRPDADPRTPGVLMTVLDVIPTAKGYRAVYAPTAHTAHTYSLAAGETYPNALFASRWLSTPGGIVIVGTNKRLNVYDYTNGFINVSHAAGDYALGGSVYQIGEDAVTAFDLCAYGDVIIAANKSVTAQKRSALDLTVATLFTDLGGATAAPAANTCCVAANFVFLGDCGNWSTVTGSPDILAWSALGDHTDWRVNPTITQASYAQFNDTPGPITAVRPFRDGVVVFKANSMYLGRYVGTGTNSPIWDFVRISDKIGCAGHRSVVNIDFALVFANRDDFYSFDGTRPASITQGIYETIKSTLNTNGETAVLVGHDKPNAMCFFSSNSVQYAWSYKYNRWTKLFPGTNVGTLTFCDTNTDDFRKKTLSTVTAGVQAYTTSTNHYNLYTLHLANGVPRNRNTTRSVLGTVYTGVFGHPEKLSTLRRVTPIFSTPPITVGNALLGAAVSQVPRASGLSFTISATMNANYRFDTLAGAGVTNNFFQLFVSVAEDFEIMDVVPTLIPAGER